MTVERYNFAEDNMEPDDNGTWVAFEDVSHLFDQRSLRDWFAGQALPMVMETMPSASASAFKSAAPEILAQAIASTAARWSYAVADAMLEARK